MTGNLQNGNPVHFFLSRTTTAFAPAYQIFFSQTNDGCIIQCNRMMRCVYHQKYFYLLHNYTSKKQLSFFI